MKKLPLYAEIPTTPIEATEAVALDTGCRNCSLHENARTVCMSADGEPGGVLILGGLPSLDDDRAGRPFVGQTGKYLRDLVSRIAGSQPVVYDNALRCYGGAAKLKPTQYVACRGYLAGVISEAKPKRILALGSVAIQMLFGTTWQPLAVRKGYGWLLHKDIPVFFLLHPTQGLRNRFIRGWFEEDLEWALTAEVPPKPPLKGIAWVAETEADVSGVLDELSGADELTIDFESFGRVHDREHLPLALGIGTVGADEAFVLPWEVLQNPVVKEHLHAFLSMKQIGGANAKFDAQLYEKLVGAPITVSWDIQQQRKMFVADQPSALKVLQPLVGMGGGKEAPEVHLACAKKDIVKLCQQQGLQPMPKLKSAIAKVQQLETIDIGALEVDWRKAAIRVDAGCEPETFTYAAIPKDVLHSYCGRDVVSTGLIKRKFDVALRERPNTARMWEQVGKPLTRAITAMEYNGIKVDINKINELSALCSRKIEAAEQELFSTYGEFDLNSAPQVAKLLYQTLGLPVTSTTDKGAPSTDAAALGTLDHPAAKAIVAWRKATKFRTQYAEGLRWHIRDDGRVHAHMRIYGTETTRLTSSDPNLYNIPRPKSEEGKLSRDIFIPEPGFELVECDLSQIEIVVAAMLSNDQKMLEICHQPGADFHLQAAKLIAPLLGIDPTTLTKEHVLRDQSKTVVFSVLYGKAAKSLGATLGIPTVRAQKLMDALFGQFSSLKAWISKCVADAKRTGGCYTWWDGKEAYWRPLWEIANPDGEEQQTAERSSYNSVVQGTATTYTNASLGEIQRLIDAGDPLLGRCKLVLTVYDSIIMEAPVGTSAEVGKRVYDIMTSWPANGAPIRAECKIGPAWGSLKTLHL